MFVPSKQFIADLQRWEKKMYTVYDDGYGNPTQGIGHTGPDVTWQSAPVDDTQIYKWITQDVQIAYIGALALFPQLDSFDLVRKEILIALVFNMGQTRLAKFVPFIQFVNNQEWDSAAFHLWTNVKGHITPYTLQVGARAFETGLRLVTGQVLREFIYAQT